MKTSEITLRAVDADDLEMLRVHRNRPDTRCWLGNAREISEEAQREWFRLRPMNPTALHGVQIAMCSGVPVGLVRTLPQVVNSQWLYSQWSVGADVFYEHRGEGFGHRVFAAACSYAIAKGARTLLLQVFLENEKAMRIYEKAGFVVDPNEPVTVFCRTMPISAAFRDYTERKILHYVTMTKEVSR